MPNVTPSDFRTILDLLPTPVIGFDRDGRHDFVNPAAYRMIGRAPDALLGRRLAEVGLPPDLAAELDANLTRVRATGEPLAHALTFPSPGGPAVLLVNLVPRPDGGVLVTAANITAPAHVEDALRASEERYRLLVESVTDYAIFILDPGGRVVSWNAGAERITGYVADEVVGHHFSLFYPPENTGKIEFELETAARTGRFAEEGWRVRKDGSRFWAGVVVTPLRDPAGRVTGFAKVIRDLTARRAAEDALRESEHRYRQVIEDQTEVVCRFRADGTFTFVNEVYCRTFGKRADELIGRRWQPIVHPDDLVHIEGELAKMSPANPVVRIENRVTDADGRVRWMEFVNRGFYAPDGALLDIQAVGRDVTDRRAAEDARRELEADLRAKEQQQRYERQLLQSQKLESLGVLAGGIAHDFNNLLTAMLGYASLSRMRLPPNDPIAEDMKRIESAAQRAAELCQQMLAYAGRGQFVVQPVDLNAMTQEMTHLLAAVLSKRAVLKYNLTVGLPQVQADPTQLRQIVMNLITNASDAIGSKSGVITLTTGLIEADARYLSEIQAAELAPGRYVYLEVSDTGCGMTEEVRLKIFDPFFTTKFTGRGLGLAAVQGIVRAHKGAIKVYTQPGKGTTFKVLFPALGALAEGLKSASAVPVQSGRGRRILVVDDEEDVRVFARKVLELIGFAVTVACDGQEGVEVFAAAPFEFALVLLDLTMPKMGGADAFREMRRHRSAVRVVLASGFAAEEATSGFEGKGLAGFLRKPFRTEDLLKVVFDAVGP